MKILILDEIIEESTPKELFVVKYLFGRFPLSATLDSREGLEKFVEDTKYIATASNVTVSFDVVYYDKNGKKHKVLIGTQIKEYLKNQNRYR